MVLPSAMGHVFLVKFSYTQQSVIEPLLCARHEAKCWWLRAIRKAVLDLKELKGLASR